MVNTDKSPEYKNRQKKRKERERWTEGGKKSRKNERYFLSKYRNELHLSNNKVMKLTPWLKCSELEEWMACGRAELNTCSALTFAPTALPRLIAFLSLCWPPEDGESTEPEPRLGLADVVARRAEFWPGLEV